MSGLAIGTRGLTKRFGPVLAVDGLDLEVREGDVYGFLGRQRLGQDQHGADAARAWCWPPRARSRCSASRCRARRPRCCPGWAPWSRGRRRTATSRAGPTCALFDAMGGGSGRRTRRRRVDDGRWSRSGSTTPADRRVRGYSLGMRQRLGLAAALLRDPRLLVLDEPTNGLDPQGIREMRDLLLELNAAGTTIFLSSHLLAEVEQLCTRVGVLDRGRLVVQEDLAVLRAPTGRTVVAHARRRRRRSPCSTAGSRSGDGERLVVRGDDAAGAQRPAGRTAGCRSASSAPSGGGWSRSCSRRPAGAGDVPVITRRAGQDAAPPADLGDDRAAQRAADAGGGAARGDRPRSRSRARGRRSSRPCSPTARCSRWPRSASCCRCSCRSRSRCTPGRPSPGRRQAGTLRYVLVRPGRPHPAARRQAGQHPGASCCSRSSSWPPSPTSSARCCSATAAAAASPGSPAPR